MENNKPAVSVKNLTKIFRIPLDKNPNLKEKILHGFRDKGYREFLSLNDVTFNVMPGEFFGIVGRNGSGKSTLLKSIAGIYTPDNGSVKVNGTLVPFIELGVGFNPELSGRENVYLSGALLGFSRKEIDDMYEEIVDFAELHDFMEERLRNYSSGMQVRLAFSIAIRARGDILLLDEVLAVGDANFQKKCFDYFEKLKNENKTVILVTHSMDQVNKFCSRALLLDSGELASVGLPSEITELYVKKNELSIQKTIEKEVNSDINVDATVSYKLSARVTKKTTKNVRVEFDYFIKQGFSAYVGISVIHNNRSIAEITTSLEKPLSGKGVLTYILDTSPLNGGEYQFNASLFNYHTRELLVVSKNINKFNISGSDPTLGGALRLKDTWIYG